MITWTQIDPANDIDIIIKTLFIHAAVYILLLVIHSSIQKTSTFYILSAWPIFTFASLIEYVIPVLEMVLPSLYFAYNLSIVVAGLVVWNISNFSSKSVFRKIFHIMCLCLFLFDYYYIPFFILSLSIVFYLMLILEFTRFGALHLQSDSFLVFVKRKSIILTAKLQHILYVHEQDSLITSHIELLVGCSLGYLIEYFLYFPSRYPVAHIGLSCIGVGDSMASWVGQSTYKLASSYLAPHNLAKLKWPKSSKTIFGSFAFYTASLGFTMILSYFQMGEGEMNKIEWTNYGISLFIATICEIYTIHDNIFCPIVLYSVYHLL